MECFPVLGDRVGVSCLNGLELGVMSWRVEEMVILFNMYIIISTICGCRNHSFLRVCRNCPVIS